jgi:hypothetical protein
MSIESCPKEYRNCGTFFSNRTTEDDQIIWYVLPLCTRHVKHDRRNVFKRRTNHCWEKKYLITSKGKLIFPRGS